MVKRLIILLLCMGSRIIASESIAVAREMATPAGHRPTYVQKTHGNPRADRSEGALPNSEPRRTHSERLRLNDQASQRPYPQKNSNYRGRYYQGQYNRAGQTNHGHAAHHSRPQMNQSAGSSAQALAPVGAE